jgi:hypothetical protein
VAANTLGTVARHDADDQAADHGDEDLQPAQAIARRRDQLRAPALEEEKVGEQTDQAQQGEGDEGAQYAYAGGQRRNGYDTPRGGEVA